MPEILFICTGNYYRSRFSEAVFNHLAIATGLDWRAFSRGLAIEMAPPGPISPHTLDRLRRRAIPLSSTGPHPRALSEADLRRATRAIAVKEVEHRPMLAARFPGWELRVEYWHVHDLDFALPDEALDELEERVRSLFAELARTAVDRDSGQNRLE